MVKLSLKRVGTFQAPRPVYQSAGAAGMDLHAAIDHPITLQPGERALIGTGFAMAVEFGYEGQIRPRSGLALKHGVTVLNSPGTIDSDYRGEVRVVLINHGQDPFEVKPGDRIAQLVITSVERVAIEFVAELDETPRGSGGYGSTGT